MAEVINLRQAKKALARAKDRAQGNANAAKFGLTKAQRQAEAAARDKAARHLDDHQRDRGTGHPENGPDAEGGG